MTSATEYDRKLVILLSIMDIYLYKPLEKYTSTISGLYFEIIFITIPRGKKSIKINCFVRYF
jgi:hypothetical protein